jgi:hypothetical protein
VPWRPDAKVIERIRNDKREDLDQDMKKRILRFAQRAVTGEVFLAEGDKNLYHSPQLANVAVSVCYTCEKPSLWVNDRVVHPPSRLGIEPNADLTQDVLADYDEARSIVDASPRGAAALLRLCIQKLCKELGEPGRDINVDIASLVRKGLDQRIQMALDVVRVIGNEAVHPGQIDLRDDRDTATQLFGLVNLIAERMISEPKHVAAMYKALPASKLKAIEKRDKSETK